MMFKRYYSVLMAKSLPESEIVHPPYFLTPPANKPGELCRLKILVIEIGFPKNRDRLVPHQPQFNDF